MTTTLKKFINQLTQLSNDIRDLFPEEKEFIIWREGLEIAVKVNSIKVIESFIYMVLPLREKVMNRQEDFFMGNEFKNKMSENAGEDITMFHNQLAKLWKNKLTDDDKETIWKYFQVMIILSERYIQEHLQK